MRPSIHPFPARMAPDLALARLERLNADSAVLDPMTGSGTVPQLAVQLGHRASAFDLDPLAVLISRVATTAVEDTAISEGANRLLTQARFVDPCEVSLPWIDGDAAAEGFISYWFAPPQRQDLRRLAYLLSRPADLHISEEVANVLRVALSRIIITKKRCASLAQDTSHSRPHRVALESDYDVLAGFSSSLSALRRRLGTIQINANADVLLGDARNLETIQDGSIDLVLTSPPYLNAIDYMRGHRLSLIWLGYRFGELQNARSNSIGSERRPDEPLDEHFLSYTKGLMGDLSSLPSRHIGFIDRYVSDLHKMIREVLRVLKEGALAIFVMGNSCLRQVYVRNSEALKAVAKEVGLRLDDESRRDLPNKHRYLPPLSEGALGKRMRQEIILTFSRT